MGQRSRQEYVEKLIPILRQQEVFTDMSDDDLRQFANSAEFRRGGQGKQIIEQGQRGNEFFVVMEGQVRAIDVSYDPPHLLNYHNAGHIVGARALLNDAPRAASVEVVVDSLLAVFDRQDWQWLIHGYPRVVDFFKNMEREFDRRAVTDFPGRQWDEVVISSTKRHILVLLGKLTVPLLLLIFPLSFLLLMELLDVDFFEQASLIITCLITTPFIGLSALLTIYHLVDWINDDFILTSKRFIHIERKLFFGEERKEAPLTRIQDVTISYPSFLNRFDYHNLTIQTAGAGPIHTNGILRAEQIKDRIFDEKARAVARVRASNVAAVRQLLAQRLDWEDALDAPIVPLAEEEGGIRTQQQTKRLPWLIDYFLPRLQEIEPDGVTITWRKHFWILIRLVGPPFLLILTALGFLLASFVLPEEAATIFATAWMRWILVALTIFGFGWYLWQYDGWRRDRYRLTDSRVVDVQSSPFGVRGENQSEGNFEDIQNITYDIPDFFHQLLNMGTVVIETAGRADTFTFQQVYNPSRIQQEIFNRMVMAQQKARSEERDDTTTNLLNIIGEYQYLLQQASERGIVNFNNKSDDSSVSLNK